MATRIRTITVPIGTDTASVAPATRRNFAAKTVYIPETGSRTFKSIEVMVVMRDDESTSGNYVSNVLIGAKLGSASFDDATIISTAVGQFSSNEHQQHRFVRSDAALVSYFNTNFGSGTSQTLQIGVQYGNVDTINVSAIVEITYEYDDASETTLAGMLYLPLDGNAGNLTSTLAALAGVSNNIPQLTGSGGLLNDMGSVVVRAISLVMQFTDAPTATTDFQFGMQIDAGAEVLSGTYRENLNSSCGELFVWTQDALDTTTAHTLNLRTTVTARGNTANALLIVQYEFAASSTTVLRSLRIPLGIEGGYAGASSGDKTLLASNVYLEDPGTLTLKQSGVQVTFIPSNRGAFTGLTAQVDGQTARAYTHAFGSAFSTACVGAQTLMQRFDSGGLQGSGLTLARGRNQIKVAVYATASDPRLSGMCAIAYLNYTCGVPAAGEGAGTRTLYFGLTSSQNQISGFPLSTFAATAPSFSATIYNVVSLGYKVVFGHASTNIAYHLQAEVLSGEGLQDGWRRVTCQFCAGGSTTISSIVGFFDAGDIFLRNTEDPDTNRLGIKSSRAYRLAATGDHQIGIGMFLTLSEIYYEAAETATGLDDPKDGVAVHLHTDPSVDPCAQRVAVATTDAAGSYTLRFFDDTEAKFAHARQSSSKVARSDQGTS